GRASPVDGAETEIPGGRFTTASEKFRKSMPPSPSDTVTSIQYDEGTLETIPERVPLTGSIARNDAFVRRDQMRGSKSGSEAFMSYEKKALRATTMFATTVVIAGGTWPTGRVYLSPA